MINKKTLANEILFPQEPKYLQQQSLGSRNEAQNFNGDQWTRFPDLMSVPINTKFIICLKLCQGYNVCVFIVNAFLFP